MTSMGAQCCQKEFKSFQVLAAAVTMNMRKKTRQNVVLCGGLEEKIWREAYIKGWAQATKGRRKPKGFHGPT